MKKKPTHYLSYRMKFMSAGLAAILLLLLTALVFRRAAGQCVRDPCDPFLDLKLCLGIYLSELAVPPL